MNFTGYDFLEDPPLGIEDMVDILEIYDLPMSSLRWTNPRHVAP